MEHPVSDEDIRVKIFFCCATIDIKYLENIEKHLSTLKKENLIESWHRREIMPGSEIEDIVRIKIERSEIIVFLISPDFFATDYIYNYEMQEALKREKEGLSIILPIYVRSFDYSDSIISRFQILPSSNVPIQSNLWDSNDAPYIEITKAIKEKIYSIRNSKRKQGFILQNSNLISRWNNERNHEEKERMTKKLSNIFVNQVIAAPFDLVISVYPVVGSRKEPEFLNWDIKKYRDVNLQQKTIKYYRSRYIPSFVVCNLINNEPSTFYIKDYCKLRPKYGDNEICKRGNLIATIDVPLIQIISNEDRKEGHWTFSSGDSGYGGILSYQPDLFFWQPDLKVRYRGMNKAYGTFKLTSPKAGILISNTQKGAVGSLVEKNDTLGVIESDSTHTKILSPVSGTLSFWTSTSGDVVHSGQTICHIRTHPILLIVESDFKVSWNTLFSCKSPISGEFVTLVPGVQKKIELIPGKEIEENIIVCGIKNNNVIVAIYIGDTIGKILEVNKTNGDSVEIGETIFLFKPKFLIIRSPMVGTFFRRPEPGKQKYCEIGDEISTGQTVCIIVAMKLKNEIESEYSGKIVTIFPDDETPVEYDQPLFKLQLY